MLQNVNTPLPDPLDDNNCVSEEDYFRLYFHTLGPDCQGSTGDDGFRDLQYCPPRYEWSTEYCGCRPTFNCPILCERGLQPHPLICGECITAEDLEVLLLIGEEECSFLFKEIECHDGSIVRCEVDDPLCRDRSPLHCPRIEVDPLRTITCPSGSTVQCPETDRDCFDGSPEYCKEIVGGLETITCPDGSVIECSAGTRDCNEDLCDRSIIEPIQISLLAGLGEVCEGFDESTGGPFPFCEPGLVCLDSGEISIPGANNRCARPLVGGLTTIRCPGGTTVECNEGVLGCFDGSPSFCPAVLAGLGETCEGFDERTGEPFPDCEEGLVCVGTFEAGIPGALNTC